MTFRRVIMSEILLFKNDNGEANLLKSEDAGLEKNLQKFIEDNLETIFGIRLLKSEYIITDGRMDSIGLDENNSPVIIEYKRSSNDNVINQGLFYLNWLLDHKGDFQILVQEKLKSNIEVDWSNPSVICIASDFNKYDEHAVKQMQKNIMLYRYKKYGNELFLLEGVNNPLQPIKTSDSKELVNSEWSKEDTEVHKNYLKANSNIKEIVDEINKYAHSLSDEVKEVYLKLYIAYRITCNFMTVLVSKSKVKIYLSLNVEDYLELLSYENIRDMRELGHYGTGDLEIELHSLEELEKYKYLLKDAYDKGQ